MTISKLCSLSVLLSLVFAPAWADELVLLGRVMDTGGSNVDTPVRGATVMIFTQQGTRIRSTLTDGNGNYSFRFEFAPELTERAYILAERSGYSRFPTRQYVTLNRQFGAIIAQQGVVLLTKDESIRSDLMYRIQVAKNIARIAESENQKVRVYQYYSSLAGLPQPAKELIFRSVKEQSESAYSELVKVDNEFKRAGELEIALREVFSDIEVIPDFTYNYTSRLRLTGTVSTKGEIEAILQQARNRGFKGDKIANEMRIKITPDKTIFMR